MTTGAAANGSTTTAAPLKQHTYPKASYPGLQHLHHRFVPSHLTPGQNLIKFIPVAAASKPSVPGYITAFRPNLTYANGRSVASTSCTSITASGSLPVLAGLRHVNAERRPERPAPRSALRPVAADLLVPSFEHVGIYAANRWMRRQRLQRPPPERLGAAPSPTTRAPVGESPRAIGRVNLDGAYR